MITKQAKNKIQEVKAKSLVLRLDKATQEEERVSKAGKRVRDAPAPEVSSSTDHQTNNPNMYTEDLA